MGLPVPRLDSRTWDELMTEARALIPEYAPAWTDHNLHDPGVTLVELDRVAHRRPALPARPRLAEKLRGFLRHVGVTPMPTGVAETVVAFRQGPGSPTAVHLRSRFQVTDTARELVFESSAPLDVSPAWIELDAAEGTDRAVIFREANGVRADVSAANAATDRSFLPFGGSPQPGDALTIGFRDQPLLPGEELGLYVWTRAGGTTTPRPSAWPGSARPGSETARTPRSAPATTGRRPHGTTARRTTGSR